MLQLQDCEGVDGTPRLELSSKPISVELSWQEDLVVCKLVDAVCEELEV